MGSATCGREGQKCPSSDTYPTRGTSARRRRFGQITRLPSGRFRARYTGPDTALHNGPTTFEAREDAEAWLVGGRRLVSAGTRASAALRRDAAARAEAQRKDRGFVGYARAWLEARHDLRPTTRASYTTALERHLIPAFGETPLHEIDAAAVRTWFAPYGQRIPTARAHAYAVLRSIMAQAEDDELIARNPVKIKACGRTEVKREPEVLNLRELLAPADAMPEKHRALTLLSGFCGLRFGEAVALRRGDLDPAAGVVHVRGTTRVGGEKIIGKPKTKGEHPDRRDPRHCRERASRASGRQHHRRAERTRLPWRGREAAPPERALRSRGSGRGPRRQHLREAGIWLLRGS